MPDRSHEALRTGVATEWICDIEASAACAA